MAFESCSKPYMVFKRCKFQRLLPALYILMAAGAGSGTCKQLALPVFNDVGFIFLVAHTRSQ